MSRLTIAILAFGVIGLTSAVNCWFVAPTRDIPAETLLNEKRRHRKKFFKVPEEKRLVGQEMRPRW